MVGYMKRILRDVMRIGKHEGCGGELHYGEMDGDGISHVLNFVCDRCMQRLEPNTIRFKYMAIPTLYPDKFIKALDKLCDRFEIAKGEAMYRYDLDG